MYASSRLYILMYVCITNFRVEFHMYVRMYILLRMFINICEGSNFVCAYVCT